MRKIEFIFKSGLCPQQAKQTTVKIKYERINDFQNSDIYQKIRPFCSYEEQHGCPECPCPLYSDAQAELSSTDIKYSHKS